MSWSVIGEFDLTLMNHGYSQIKYLTSTCWEVTFIKHLDAHYTYG
ncbi:hypothetical protein [Caldivirga sp.]|nr:hypothetical protein [Caldivirga sp.]